MTKAGVSEPDVRARIEHLREGSRASHRNKKHRPCYLVTKWILGTMGLIWKRDIPIRCFLPSWLTNRGESVNALQKEQGPQNVMGCRDARSRRSNCSDLQNSFGSQNIRRSFTPEKKDVSSSPTARVSSSYSAHVSATSLAHRPLGILFRETRKAKTHGCCSTKRLSNRNNTLSKLAY